MQGICVFNAIVIHFLLPLVGSPFRSFFQNVTNNQSSFVLLLSALLLAAFRCRTRNNKAIMVTIPYKSFSARKFVARSNQARYQSNMYTMQRVILMPVKWQ
jgi:hypothetical protein